MEKYNNGRPISVPENEKEKALAISEWAEGNEHLQNALASCIDNGIQTYASCKRTWLNNISIYKFESYQ